MTQTIIEGAPFSRYPYPPQLKGLPILGSALPLSKDILPVLLHGYKEIGPIFRLKALNQQFTVMAGPEANQFLSREGNDLFSVTEIYRGFSEGMQSENFLLGHDGAHHTYLRKLLRRGYSKGAAAPYLQHMADLTQAAVQEWQPGQQVKVVPFFKRLVTQQLGTMLARRAPDEYLDDVQRFFTTLAMVTVAGLWPSVLLKLPPYKKAQARVLELTRQVVDDHRANPSPAGSRDIVDDVMAAMQAGNGSGQRPAEDTFNAVVIGSYLAGIDTVSMTCSFMTYAMLKERGLRQRVMAEVDTFFADGIPSLNDLRQMEVLPAAVTETLRYYPVAPGITRMVKEPFVFAGHRVDVGEQVIVGTAVTHFLPEYFPDPHTFDIDRHIKPNRQARQPGIFAPFALGSHTCLGAGMAEIQVMMNIATLFRAARLQLSPPDYELEISNAPTRGPKESFTVTMLGRM